MVETKSLAEAKYLLERAMRTRGLHPTIEARTFTYHMTVGKFSLSFMPGNRRILISHDTFVEPKFRGLGYGRAWLKLKEELAREAGINLLLATVRNENKIEVHLLRTNGWKRILNRKTKVSLWSKTL
jgi:GNAT superfamily N-acetyltransferase